MKCVNIMVEQLVRKKQELQEYLLSFSNDKVTILLPKDYLENIKGKKDEVNKNKVDETEKNSRNDTS